MKIKEGAKSVYDSGPVYIVPDEARAEKCRIWHELRGCAHGYAEGLKHPAWREVWEDRLRRKALHMQGYTLVDIETEAGGIAHVGSMYEVNGCIRLEG